MTVAPVKHPLWIPVVAIFIHPLAGLAGAATVAEPRGLIAKTFGDEQPKPGN